MQENIYLTNEIFRELLKSGSISEEMLKSIYRRFSKETHPDVTGKDGREFQRIHQEYEEAHKYLKKHLVGMEGPEGELNPFPSFSPTRVIVDCGYHREINPRTAVYIGLYRYVTAGLHSHRVRSKSTLGKRNLEIIRTIVYWSYLYDPGFIPIFVDYNRQYAVQYRKFFRNNRIVMCRRLFQQGLRLFLLFQDQGRSTAREIAADKLSFIVDMSRFISPSPSQNSIYRFSQWLLAELEKESTHLSIMN